MSAHFSGKNLKHFLHKRIWDFQPDGTYWTCQTSRIRLHLIHLCRIEIEQNVKKSDTVKQEDRKLKLVRSSVIDSLDENHLSITLSPYLSIQQSIYQSINQSINLSIYVSICLNIYLFNSLSINQSIYLRISIYVSIYLSIYLFNSLSINQSINLPTYLNLCMYLCIYVCIYVSMYVCMYVSIYLPILIPDKQCLDLKN